MQNVFFFSDNSYLQLALKKKKKMAWVKDNKLKCVGWRKMTVR